MPVLAGKTELDTPHILFCANSGSAEPGQNHPIDRRQKKRPKKSRKKISRKKTAATDFDFLKCPKSRFASVLKASHRAAEVVLLSSLNALLIHSSSSKGGSFVWVTPFS